MPYMSTREAAEHYGVTTRTIRNWCEAGAIKAKRFGKLWRVWIDDEKGRAAHEEQPKDEASVTSTLEGDYTWKTVS